jgi:Ca-activated chloride channel family protein
VGFGTEAGSTIPIRDGSVVREKRDENGKVVVTRYHPELLKGVAEAANGTFVPAEVSDKATRVRGALRSLRTARRAVDSREDHVPRFLWALVPALLLLLYDTWLQVRGARRTQTVTVSSGTAAMLLAVGSATSCAHPPDPARLYADGNVRAAIAGYRDMIARGDTTALTRYNLGTVLLGVDSLTEAAELLEGVRRSTDGELRMRARYNAGLAQLRLGRLPDNQEKAQSLAAARAAYRALLQDRFNDADAKWNYELALRHPPPNGGGGGGGGGNNSEAPPQQNQSQGQLDQHQAEALLNSAAREERDVQGRKQRQGKVPPVGKDW